VGKTLGIRVGPQNLHLSGGKPFREKSLVGATERAVLLRGKKGELQVKEENQNWSQLQQGGMTARILLREFAIGGAVAASKRFDRPRDPMKAAVDVCRMKGSGRGHPTRRIVRAHRRGRRQA